MSREEMKLGEFLWAAALIVLVGVVVVLGLMGLFGTAFGSVIGEPYVTSPNNLFIVWSDDTPPEGATLATREGASFYLDPLGWRATSTPMTYTIWVGSELSVDTECYVLSLDGSAYPFGLCPFVPDPLDPSQYPTAIEFVADLAIVALDDERGAYVNGMKLDLDWNANTFTLQGPIERLFVRTGQFYPINADSTAWAEWRYLAPMLADDNVETTEANK